MSKLAKSAWPSGHSANDFKCFGPIATKDGEFSDSNLCDLGCFTQDGKDSNKFYHGAVVQSKVNSKWYAYFEFGKTGANTVGFQFIECSSQSEAQSEYEKQMHSKNDKRGQWITHKILGKILQAKPGKDCYLVRPQASRSVGLPDAQNITTGTVQTTTVVAPVNGKVMDKESLSLLNDLNVSTLDYTRSSMSNNAVPTADAINEARQILKAATDVINTKVDEKELVGLTNILYSRIPKKKDRSNKDWMLNQNNIQLWSDDLDAFESALLSNNKTVVQTLDNLPFFLEWLSPASELGRFIHNWMPTATKNRHGGVGNLKIVNVWKVEKQSDKDRFTNKQRAIVKSDREVPLHQISRADLDKSEVPLYNESGTYMLFHGTRSVNVSGILRESLRMPAQLHNVVISGAMFGPGNYHADDWKKSAGYTSSDSSYWAAGGGKVNKRNAFMFVNDVALGNMYVPPHSGNYYKHIDNKNYHSVFGKMSQSGVANNEFITFDTKQTLLRYLVEFKC
jgi:hypothetical protein